MEATQRRLLATTAPRSGASASSLAAANAERRRRPAERAPAACPLPEGDAVRRVRRLDTHGAKAEILAVGSNGVFFIRHKLTQAEHARGKTTNGQRVVLDAFGVGAARCREVANEPKKAEHAVLFGVSVVKGTLNVKAVPTGA